MSFHLVLAGERHYTKEHCCSEMSAQANAISIDSERPLHGTTDKRIY